MNLYSKCYYKYRMDYEYDDTNFIRVKDLKLLIFDYLI